MRLKRFFRFVARVGHLALKRQSGWLPALGSSLPRSVESQPGPCQSRQETFPGSVGSAKVLQCRLECHGPRPCEPQGTRLYWITSAWPTNRESRALEGCAAVLSRPYSNRFRRLCYRQYHTVPHAILLSANDQGLICCVTCSHQLPIFGPNGAPAC
jgi:hypothetical protein